MFVHTHTHTHTDTHTHTKCRFLLAPARYVLGRQRSFLNPVRCHNDPLLILSEYINGQYVRWMHDIPLMHHPYKSQSLMELKLGFRKYLEGWDREGGGRDVQLEGVMGKFMSDSY